MNMLEDFHLSNQSGPKPFSAIIRDFALLQNIRVRAYTFRFMNRKNTDY